MQPYAPLHKLKPIAESLWSVDGPVVHMSALGFRVPFPTRMSVVRLANGSLWCHSPIAPNDGLFATLDTLGPVRHLISPNWLHYAHIRAWHDRYPEAITWASPGVRRRAASRHIDVQFNRDLEDQPPPDWGVDLDQLLFRGSSVHREFVFFHRTSGTLILTDLIENFEASRLPLPMRLMAWVGGVLSPDGKTPADLRATFRHGKREARDCLAQMLAWQPRRILIAHGRCYPEQAERELRRAFRWLY